MLGKRNTRKKMTMLSHCWPRQNHWHNIKWDHFDILANGKTDYSRVVQSPIKLTRWEFWFLVSNFLVRCYVYIVCPSVLSCSNLKLHQTLQVKSIFKQEKIIMQLTFNRGLTLTGFRTTRPLCIPWQELEPAFNVNIASEKLTPY